jgi:cold-inducible RNA-binding protein
MRIFVGGIPYTTNSEALRSLFAEAGDVTEATVVQDKYTGDSKGFGFVEMPNADEARTAIGRFNGHSLDGRPLTVNEAKPREERGTGGGGNRFAGAGASRGGRW